jgi:hypothetical protein
VKPVALISNTLKLFLNEAELIEKLNEIKINELTNYQFFKQNTFVISPSYTSRLIIYPLTNRNTEHYFHFSSLYFDDILLKDNEKVDVNKIVEKNLNSYLSFCMKINYLAYFILNFIQRNGGVFLILIGDTLNYTATQSICNVVNYTDYAYSDTSINFKKDFTVNMLGINKTQKFNLQNSVLNFFLKYLQLKNVSQIKIYWI